MIDYPGIGVADVAGSVAFYDAILSVLGLRRVMQLPDNRSRHVFTHGAVAPAD